MFYNGNLNTEIINEDKADFSLKGMVMPTFQNQGESDILFNGLLIKKDESFPVFVPNVVLQNSVSIQFLSEVESERKLLVCYVRLQEN